MKCGHPCWSTFFCQVREKKSYAIQNYKEVITENPIWRPGHGHAGEKMCRTIVTVNAV